MTEVEHQDFGPCCRRARMLADINDERERQLVKWGPQSHNDGTGHPFMREQADRYRNLCDIRFKKGTGTWLDILLEEVFEAAAEADPVALRKELVQVGAVAGAWVEDIDMKLATPREEHDRELDEVREKVADWPVA